MKTKEIENIGVGGRIQELSLANPGCAVTPLVNGGAIIEVGKTPLNLADLDLGLGTTVVRMYRCPIGDDYDRLEQIAEKLADPGAQKQFLRAYKELSSMLDREFLYNFSASQKKLIKRETGCMIGSGAFLKITTDDWTRWPYLLLFSGSPALSAIISDGSRYRTAADQLHDLEMAQEYAKRSRKLCLLRLGKLFYNVDIIDDGFFHYGDYPCHTIDTANQKIYLTSKPSMERKNLFLGGRFGDIIFSPRPGREEDITTPVLTGFEDGAEKEGRKIIPNVIRNCRGVALRSTYSYCPNK